MAKIHVNNSMLQARIYQILPALTKRRNISLFFLTKVSVISCVLGICWLAKAMLILTIFLPKVFVFQLD